MNEYNIGLKLKESRKARNMTLQQVAEVTGTSTALLSQIENSNVTPSLKTLLKLASYYEISMSTFFKENSATAKYSISRKTDHGKEGKYEHPLAAGKNSCSTLLPLATKQRMRCYLMDVKRVTSIEKTSSRCAETFLYIIDGTLEMITENEKFSVAAGDSIYLYDVGKINVKPVNCKAAKIMRIEAES